MKTFILSFTLLIISHVSKSQTKPTAKDILGSWKVIAFEKDGGKVYGDLVKDSLFIDDEVKKTWSTAKDTIVVMGAMEFMMKIMKDTEMVFGENGIFVEKRKDKSQEGSYTYDESTAVLTTNMVGEKSMQASMINSNLQLKMETNKGKILIMHLKKE